MKGGWAVLAAVGIASMTMIAWVFWPRAATDGPATVDQTRTDGGAGGVTVTATLLARADPGRDLEWNVSLETHTVDLAGFDLLGSVVLRTGADEWTPLPESAVSSNDGHHLAARLVFPDVRTHEAILVVRDLAGVAERQLVFHL